MVTAIPTKSGAMAVAKGYILETMEQWDAAEEHYRQALARNPNAWQMACRLGATLIQQRQIAEALPYFERCQEMAPGNVFEPIQGLATVYFNVGMTQEAINVLQNFLQRNPNHPQATSMLQSVRRALSNESAPRDTAAPGSPE